MIVCFVLFFFFFSSRRRHTRCSRDWSSDVCSSDLRGRFKMIGKPSASGAITLGVTGSGISISTLINVLQQYVDRPIVDASGVDGLYEVQLEFGLPQSQAAAPLDEPVGVALFTALQEQLGLKFDAVRKPVEVLVIDRAEHPK